MNKENNASLEASKQQLCIKCQYCCTILAIPASDFELSFYATRGIKTIDDISGTAAIIPHYCQHLTSQGCAIYPDRPIECKLFDGSIDPSTKDKCLWNKHNQERA